MDVFQLYGPHRLVQLTLWGQMALQQIRNVFYMAFEDYNFVTGPEITTVKILNDLAAQFISEVAFGFLQDFTVTTMSYQLVEAIASDDSTKFVPGLRGVDVLPFNGAAAEDALPTYDAISFRMLPISPSFSRSGYKRIAGVPESCQDDGLTTLTAGALTAAVDFAEWMEEDHVLTVTGEPPYTYHTAIPRTVKSLDTGKYEILGGYLVTDVNIQPQIKTQASRKRGVGI